MSSDFSATISDGNTPHVKVVHLKGELDEESVEHLRKEVDPLLADESVTKVVFDFSNLEFINSKGIGYLVSVHTHLAKNERVLVIAGGSEPVMDVISLVGLTKIIAYHDTVEEALGN